MGNWVELFIAESETTDAGDSWLYNEPQNTSPTRSNPNGASLYSPGEFYDIDFVVSSGANISFVFMSSSISNDWSGNPRGGYNLLEIDVQAQ